ncbi:MAG: hypothetical protein EZS28_000348 [Streblomastix strix]|uniref:Uncharacterized protein n=1 Tax=Streblomastix strix TaxID=222440 RepID=A0A5J4XAG7_9EUKA|nr:MAG: hypothetical protein EZS28_000348 [Streblomastix strix]
MESSISNSTSGERDFSSPQQCRYNDQHGTSPWVGELDCRCIEHPVMDRILSDQPSSSQRSTSVNQLPIYSGHLRPQNKQVIEKILFALRRQQSNLQKHTEHSMDQRATSPTFSQRFHPESNSEDDQRSNGSCTNTSKMVPQQVQNNASSNSELSNTRTIRSSSNKRKDNERTLKTTNRNHRDDKDKYKEGEQLYRELAELTKLDSVAIDQLIAGINPETWRKGRAGLPSIANYLKQNNINTSTLLGNKPDVELVNALAWYKERRGPKFQQRMKNMKMHCGVMLSQFSQMNNINNSSLVKTNSKGQRLSIQSKPRFPTIQNLQILFNYINTHAPTTPEDIQQTAMAMIVAFCAAI